MTEKRFEVVINEFDEVEYIMDKVAMEDRDFAEFIDFVEDICNENEQLKQQLQIFEKFLEGNDLSIDWEEFCGLEECAFENPDFSCKSCIYLKGDV